jgi:hypothetical protein
MTRGQVEANHALSAIFLIVLVEQPANLVRLHAHNGIFLRIEVNAAVVDLYSDKVLIQLVAVAQQGLLAHKLEEPGLFGRSGKMLAFEDPAQFFAPLEERDGGSYGRVNGRHFEFSGGTADKRVPLASDVSSAWVGR